MNKQMAPESWHMILSLQRVTISASLLLNSSSNQTSKISSSKKASYHPSLLPKALCVFVLS